MTHPVREERDHQLEERCLDAGSPAAGTQRIKEFEDEVVSSCLVCGGACLASGHGGEPTPGDYAPSVQFSLELSSPTSMTPTTDNYGRRADMTGNVRMPRSGRSQSASATRLRNTSWPKSKQHLNDGLTLEEVVGAVQRVRRARAALSRENLVQPPRSVLSHEQEFRQGCRPPP